MCVRVRVHVCVRVRVRVRVRVHVRVRVCVCVCGNFGVYLCVVMARSMVFIPIRKLIVNYMSVVP